MYLPDGLVSFISWRCRETNPRFRETNPPARHKPNAFTRTLPQNPTGPARKKQQPPVPDQVGRDGWLCGKSFSVPVLTVAGDVREMKTRRQAVRGGMRPVNEY